MSVSTQTPTAYTINTYVQTTHCHLSTDLLPGMVIMPQTYTRPHSHLSTDLPHQQIPSQTSKIWLGCKSASKHHQHMVHIHTQTQSIHGIRLHILLTQSHINSSIHTKPTQQKFPTCTFYSHPAFHALGLGPAQRSKFQGSSKAECMGVLSLWVESVPYP